MCNELAAADRLASQPRLALLELFVISAHLLELSIGRRHILQLEGDAENWVKVGRRRGWGKEVGTDEDETTPLPASPPHIWG